MNWIDLHTSPLWKGLFESEEVQTKIKAMHQLLVHGNIEGEARGVVRGQLKLIESLPLLVEAWARQQKAREAAAFERSTENAEDVHRFVSDIPTIY